MTAGIFFLSVREQTLRLRVSVNLRACDIEGRGTESSSAAQVWSENGKCEAAGIGFSVRFFARA